MPAAVHPGTDLLLVVGGWAAPGATAEPPTVVDRAGRAAVDEVALRRDAAVLAVA